jgi:hypothetical protein
MQLTHAAGSGIAGQFVRLYPPPLLLLHANRKTVAATPSIPRIPMLIVSSHASRAPLRAARASGHLTVIRLGNAHPS